MIDKNGKLFGKINVIDLFVILVLVAAIAVFGVTKLQRVIGVAGTEEKDGSKKTTVTKSITLELVGEEVPEYVIPHIEKGEDFYDADRDEVIGTLKSVEVGDSISYAVDAEGNHVVGSKEGYKSVRVVIDVKEAKIEDNGVDIEGGKYGIGHTFTVRSGFAKMYLRVCDIVIK